jgi:hypothetical protein
MSRWLIIGPEEFAADRIETWLTILMDEGAIARGDNAARAPFLLAVLDGLALQRTLSTGQVPLEAGVPRGTPEQAVSAPPGNAISVGPDPVLSRGRAAPAEL